MPNVQRSQGVEIIWVVSYLPVIFPTGLGYGSFWSNFEPAVAKFIEAGVGARFAPTMSNWLGFSFIGLLQSALLLSAVWAAKGIRRAPVA